MRPLLPALLLLGSILGALAEDRKLEDRIMKPDMTREYDMRQSALGGQSFNSGKDPSKGKEFSFTQKVDPKEYQTREYSSSKWNWFSSLKFFAKGTEAKGKYTIPNADKSAESKTMAIQDSRYAEKTARTRELPGGNRPYLGKESTKINTTLDPANLPRTTGEMREIKTIDDVRELLNKSK